MRLRGAARRRHLVDRSAVFGPVHSPIPSSLGPAEVAARYANNTVGIRAGMVCVLVGGALYGAWTAVITVQLKRIEGRSSVMAYTQLALGAAFVLVFVVPVVFWQAGAFRPLDNIEITQRLNDLAWMGFLIPVPVITVQGLAITLAILSDKSSSPAFPRWLGWFNLWAQIIFLPGVLIPFFKHRRTGLERTARLLDSGRGVHRVDDHRVGHVVPCDQRRGTPVPRGPKVCGRIRCAALHQVR
jgi:hypothetical protein